MTDKPQEEKKESSLPRVKIFLAKKDGAIKAYVHLTVNVEGIGPVAINGLKIVEGQKGTFVGMPSIKFGEEYRDIVFPVSKEAYANLQAGVLKAWTAFQAKGDKKASPPPADEEVPF